MPPIGQQNALTRFRRVPVKRRDPYGSTPNVGERGANTHRRILEAALIVFAEHGFHDTQVEMITEAAGCSRPAFYQYFSNKEDVFWRLANELSSAMDDLANTVGRSTPDVAGLVRTRAWFEGLIDVYTTYHPVFQVYPAASSGPSRTSMGSRKVSERIGAKIAPRLPSPALLLPILHRSTHYWRTGVGGIPKSRFVEAAARTLHRIQHGAIRGVNIGPVVKAPPRRVPGFPASPEAAEPPKQGRGRDTRASLLASAGAVLPSHGYHGTRVDDIVAHAGVSHGTFYRYFSSKDDVFRVLAEGAARSMFDLVNDFPDDVSGPDLERWLGRWFDQYWAHGGVISAWQEIEYDDAELGRFSIDVAIAVFDRMCRVVHRRGFGDSIVDGLVLLAVLERVPYSVRMFGRIGRDEAIATTATVIRQGILGVVL